MPPQTLPAYRRPVGYLEAFLMGGLSLLLFLYFFIFVDKSVNIGKIASFAFSLAFVVNYPHFMASYYILYKDNLPKLLTNLKFAWAGIVVPGLLLGGFSFIFFFQEKLWLGYMVNLMFFSVGWHYVKQIFGCVVVSNIFKTYFYSPFQRRIILFNLYALWVMAWLPGNLYGSSFHFYSLSYKGFNVAGYIQNALTYFGWHLHTPAVGKFILTAMIVCVGLSLAWIIAFHLYRYIKENKLPHLAGFLSFVSLYLWYIPTFHHPSYAYLIPFLHSLQYLALVRIYRFNLEDSYAAEARTASEKRKKVVVGLTVFTAVIGILGALTFSIIPNYLDKHYAVIGLGSQAFLISFILFINIHHYFIDNILWKKENDLVGKYLFGKT